MLVGSPYRWGRNLATTGRVLTILRRESIVLKLILPDIFVILDFQETIPERLLLRVLRGRSLSAAKETWSISHCHLSERRIT